MSKLRIFVASPGDVSEERDIVSVVVEELRRTIGNIRKIELETVRWETHAWPDVGADAQDVINREIGKFDVLVGIMWKRFGTPTKRSTSGTGEEFEKAYDLFVAHGRPKIMFYFRKTPFYTTSDKELAQFKKVIHFRKKLEKPGVLFWEYDRTLDFERDVREHLMRQILEVTEPAEAKPKSVAPLVFLSCAREDSNRVLPVYRALATAGFKPWLDIQDLLPGQEWESEVQKTIKQADIFLVFLSETTQARKGYVQKEVRYAEQELDVEQLPESLRLIPVRLDSIEPPANLMKYQWFDLFYPDSVEKLISAMLLLIGKK